MRRVLISLILALASTLISAETISFMGIPISGTRDVFEQKLLNKGFSGPGWGGRYEGHFNGHYVYVSVWSENNRVYRVDVEYYVDKNSYISEYNTLLQQFSNNKKYAKEVVSYIPQGYQYNKSVETSGKSESLFESCFKHVGDPNGIVKTRLSHYYSNFDLFGSGTGHVFQVIIRYEHFGTRSRFDGSDL